MTEPNGTPGESPTNASPATNEPDWADQVTALIVDSVDRVRDRTTGPVLELAKGLVQAVVAVLILTPILVLAVAGTVRLINWAVPGDVWIAYAIMGALLVALGLVLWSRRGPLSTPPG